MIGQQEGEIQYRRGVVLGLTMAEIMLLLIFLLLILLAVKIKEIVAERDLIVQSRTDIERELTSLKERIVEAGGVDALVWAKEYVKVKEENAKLKEREQLAEPGLGLIERKQAVNPDQSPEEAAAEIEREAALGQKAEDAARSLFPDDPSEQALEKMIEAAKIAAAVDKQETDIRTLLTDAESCTKELEACTDQNVGLRKKVKGGSDHPSCWYDENGDQQYLFNLYFRNEGILVVDNKVAGREADQAELPLSKFVFGTPMSGGSFRVASDPVLTWSKNQKLECRFFVRIYDETGNDKERFNDLRFAVESAFYKFEVNPRKSTP